jgi:hypothetical protein
MCSITEKLFANKKLSKHDKVCQFKGLSRATTNGNLKITLKYGKTGNQKRVRIQN